MVPAERKAPLCAELEMAKAAARSKAAKKNDKRKAKKDAVADMTAGLASVRSCPAAFC